MPYLEAPVPDDRPKPVVPTCPSDKPVGIAVMIIAAGLLLVEVAAFTLLTALLQPMFGGATYTNFNGAPFMPARQEQPPVLVMAIAGVIVGATIYLLVNGLAIANGVRWGFWSGIILFTLMCLFGNGLAILGALLAAYCILRLNKLIGPDPM